MKQKMGIMFDSFSNSWECERKALVEKASDLKYNEIIPKLKEKL